MAFDPFAGTAASNTMDFQLAGLSLGIAGTIGSVGASMQQATYQEEAAQVSEQIGGEEQSVNAMKQMQMNLTSQRQQMQNLRNVQRTKAAGLAGATGTGAQFGSGLKGAQASETAAGATNALDINQNQMIGNKIFSETSQIDAEQMRLANIQGNAAYSAGQAAIWGGVASLGTSLFSSAKFLGPIA